jgi:hypothetical protein
LRSSSSRRSKRSSCDSKWRCRSSNDSRRNGPDSSS